MPQDKVDATLRDQQEYISRLVREDLGFGQQIDNALKRIEIQRQLEEAEQNEDEDGLLMSDEEILAARAAEEEDFLKDLMDTGEEAEM